MAENGTLQKVKKWTAYGAAFLVFLAVSSGIWMVVTEGYAFAQKVEVYVSLPQWLERVETKIDVTLEKVGSIEKRIHDLEHNP